MGLWDLRARRPLLVKDHMYGDAIRDIKFHSGGVSGGTGGGACAVTAFCVSVETMWISKRCLLLLLLLPCRLASVVVAVCWMSSALCQQTSTLSR